MTKKILLTCMALFLALPSLAEDMRQRLQQVEGHLLNQEQQASTLKQKASNQNTELQNLKKRLIAMTNNLQSSETAQFSLEDKQAALEAEIATRTEELNKNRAQLGIFTRALISLAQKPVGALILQTPMTLDYIHRALILRDLVPRLRNDIAVAMENIATLQDMRLHADEGQKIVLRSQQMIDLQRTKLAVLIGERQKLLSQTQDQVRGAEQQRAKLEREVKTLRQLLDKISQPTAGGEKPNVWQGMLKVPVAGTIIRGYGSRDNYGVVSRGVTLSARSGSAVVAPADGKVVFVGPFHGYGQIIILEHKGGNHSFMSGFGQIDARMGQEVQKGEPIGNLAGSGGKQELYFEWRHNGESVNPVIES